MIDIRELELKAKQFRREILETISNAGAGHPGGSLSAIDLLTVLYFSKLKIDSQRPCWSERDRFIMSKGHASPAIYVALANRGFFPKEELKNFRKLGSILQGHVYNKVPGIELSTGSLGQGFSFANGIALAAKIKGEKFRVYCLLGDGELQEGQIWEAAMTAVQHKLDNICIIIDANKVQQNGLVADIKNEEPLAAKFKDFGFEVAKIDGHNFKEIIKALDGFGKIKNKPYLIKANTIKGKGVSFMELNSKWHGKAPDKDELERAIKELI